jgi:Flp pilus assembly protein TadG
VEFAVVLPVLMAFILGIIYFGRFEDYNNQVTQLAEEGARAAAVDFNPPGTSTLQQYILSQAQPELQSGSSDVTQAQVFIYYPTTQPISTTTLNQVGNVLRACVVTSMTFPLPLKLTNSTAPIVQTATFRIVAVQTTGAWAPDATTTAGAAGCPTS